MPTCTMCVSLAPLPNSLVLAPASPIRQACSTTSPPFRSHVSTLCYLHSTRETPPRSMTRQSTILYSSVNFSKLASPCYGSAPLRIQATASPVVQPANAPGAGKETRDDRVQQIHTVEEFDNALKVASRKLVVVEFAASHSVNSRNIYPAMVDLSRTCQDVVFLLVLGDESEGTKDLCVRAGIEKVPHFIFYRNAEIVHEEEGIDAEQLTGDVLYYGDNDAPIHQLHSKADIETLLQQHASDHKLVVLDVGLKSCGPCVKVYPTFVKLSKRMAETAVFARIHGDENEDCTEFLRSMNVVEVPTFLFIRDGKMCGRYVGSGKGELIGEILRHQGVRVTY